jgi:hypothetical protein
MKHYGDGGEYVHELEHWMDEAYDGQKPVIVEGMKREKGGEMMWCNIDGEFVCTKDSCGNQCEDYDPCNKKSGRCRELKQGFTGTGQMYKITEKGSVRKEKP